jgi:hypothetical protein
VVGGKAGDTRHCTKLNLKAESLLYKSKYIPLHGAVRLIADRLAAMDAQKYADAGAAIDDAREQLLEALFEGAVRAEGVRCHPAAPPSYEAPSIEYDEWSPINQGVWIHEKYEKLNDFCRLNTITVHWNEDYIAYFDSDDEWADCIDWKIRLLCEDINREFSPSEAATQPQTPPSEPPDPIYRTGVAGRPSSIHLVKREMQSRAAKGELLSSLAAELRALLQWLEEHYPDAPPLGQKAAQNQLRDEYKRLKAIYLPK